MTFGTVVNCMDGRAQLPVLTYLKERFGVDHVDNITEAGPDRILARRDDPTLVESICRRIEISRTKHGSRQLAIVGHADCGGNPVSAQEHHAQIREAVLFLRGRYPDMCVIGLWLNPAWIVEEVVTESAA